MKIAILFGAWCLSFRGSLPFAGHRSDPRGLTGSEFGFIRIAQELHALGHEVTAFTVSPEREYEGLVIRSVHDRGDLAGFDAAVSINEPDLLRDTRAGVRVCEAWLNGVDWCQVGFEKHVDLWTSPSQGHLEMMLSETHEVQPRPTGPLALFRADPANWVVNELGCDPYRYFTEPITEWNGKPLYCASPPYPKVPGRVVYCSSPDRGLHWLLQEWPAIKRAVPHATLRIFYRLQAWIDGFSETAYSPPIEELRGRAVYVQECLRRMSGPEWGITVLDSVSREQIEREMCEAEVLAYPVDTTRWSEGFSCTILEACAARACPVITDCDALGKLYGGHCAVFPRDQLDRWRDGVIEALSNEPFRDSWNDSARTFAETLTWRKHAERLVAAIEARRPMPARRAPAEHLDKLEKVSENAFLSIAAAQTIGWGRSKYAIREACVSCPCCDTLAVSIRQNDCCHDCEWYPGMPVDRERPSSHNGKSSRILPGDPDWLPKDNT